MLLNLLQKLRPLFIHLSERYPFMRKPLNFIWNLYDRVKYRYYVTKNLRKSVDRKARINPNRIYKINAKDVEFKGPFDYIIDTARIYGGDWDKKADRFEEIPVYQCFEKHFVKGIPWEETDRYIRHLKQVKKGKHVRCKSKEGLKRWYSMYDELYDSIEKEGYKTQGELIRNSDGLSQKKGTKWAVPPLSNSAVLDEIAVSIGRNGRFYLDDGRHRLSIAKILDIEVPVRIVVRHKEWQKLRGEIAREVEIAQEEEVENVREYIREEFEDRLDEIFLGIDHPDLSVLLEES